MKSNCLSHVEYTDKPSVGPEHWANSAQTSRDSHKTPKENHLLSPKAEVRPFQSKKENDGKGEETRLLEDRVRQLEEELRKKEDAKEPLQSID